MIRAAGAIAQADEDRRVDDVAHGNVVDRDILDVAAVHALHGQAAAVVEDAIGDGDVLEAAVGFGAELDAAGPPARQPAASALEGAVQQCSLDIAAGHVTVGDGDVFRRAQTAEGVAALQADAVIPGRIHAAIGNAHVVAAINVHAVAVGVELDIVDGEVVHAGGEDGKVAAVQDGDVAEDDVVAVLQADRLVADARRRILVNAARPAPAQALPWIRPGPMMETFSDSRPR